MVQMLKHIIENIKISNLSPAQSKFAETRPLATTFTALSTTEASANKF